MSFQIVSSGSSDLKPPNTNKATFITRWLAIKKVERQQRCCQTKQNYLKAATQQESNTVGGNFFFDFTAQEEQIFLRI